MKCGFPRLPNLAASIYTVTGNSENSAWCHHVEKNLAPLFERKFLSQLLNHRRHGLSP